MAKVSGRVTVGGAPLPGGRITFRPADPAANSVSAELDEQGRYQVMLPVGEVAVSIDNREFRPKAARGPIELPGMDPELRAKLAPNPAPAIVVPNEKSGRYLPIAERYYNADSSGLGFTVTKGDMVKDFELTK
jgi:hypothetical protein